MCGTRSAISVNRLRRDINGSSLVEFTLVFPVLILVALGTIDVTLMLFEWAMANKAVYRGARVAVVSSPVATGITNPTYDPLLLGESCFNSGTGIANGNCPSASSIC